MIPLALVFVAGYVALTRAPATVVATEPPSTPALSFLARATRDPSRTFRSLAAAAAALVTLLGAAPMALASTNPDADAIVTEALNGTPQVTDTPAPHFSLTDQQGRVVTLASLHGKAIALTFLDPVCTTDCPLIGQEFREADEALGARAVDTEFIAIVANPLYRSSFFTNAFDREQGLNHLRNWLFLTGSVSTLSNVWDDYGIQVTVSPAGAMVDHGDIAYVIDASGHTRDIMSADPGAGGATSSSFVTLLDQELNRVMPPT
jgi:protein SCO1/2